jgi:competence protein ComEC
MGSFAAWWVPAAAAGAGLAAAMLLLAAAVAPLRMWCAVACAVAICAGSATATVARSGLEPPAEALRRPLTLQASITSSPRQIAGRNADEERVALSLTVHGYSDGRNTWSASLPARLFADRERWGAFAMGTQVWFRGRIEAPEAGSTVAVVVPSGPVRIHSPPTGPSGAAAVLRAGLADAVTAGSDDAASLVAGLAIGDETRQDPAFADRMQVAGLSHLTAVSGGNVVVVLAMVLLPLRLLRAPVPVQTAAAAAALFGYVVLVGPQPSVLRAAAMGATALVGVLAGGAQRGLSVLGSCALLLVLGSPALSVSLGFALSVVATGALIVGSPVAVSGLRAVPLLRRVPRPVLLALAVAATAQLATAPLLLAIGAPVSWVALPANVAAAPLVPPITALGLLAAAAGPLAPAVAGWLGAAALWFADLLVRIADTAAAAAAAPAVPRVLIPVAAGAAFAVVVLAGSAGGRRLRMRPMLAVAAMLVLLLWPGGPVLGGAVLGGSPRDWRVVVCDVGQGSAVVLRDAATTGLLVDAGPEGPAAADCLAGSGIRQVTTLVITHFHADHIGGLEQVLQRFDVGQLVTTGFLRPADAAAQVLRLAHEHGVPVRTAAAGQRLALSAAESAVLWPPPGFVGDDDAANNSSLVLRTVWQDGFSVLSTGDIESEAQEALLADAAALRSDVVIVPHHGSDNQDPRFGAAADATVAVASLGQGNSYGHPAAQTVAEYSTQGRPPWRTDQTGTVVVAADVDQLRVVGTG